MCCMLDVSESGYRSWKLGGKPHHKRLTDTQMLVSPFGTMAPRIFGVMAPLETMDFGVRTGSRMRDFSSFCNVRF